MTKTTILIVEDDFDLREAIVDTLTLSKFKCVEACNGVEALEKLSGQPIDMIVSDVNMDEMDGYELLANVKEKYPQIPMLLVTAHGQVSKAVDAIKAGAADYLLKPFPPASLLEVVKKYVGNETAKLSDEPVAKEASSLHTLKMARKVAVTDSTVLIAGESGTGKEVLAKYIHNQSHRADGPFVAINCAAIPENMLEATLFGYEKGAYTGAYQSMPGKFEQANGGTILLDEISEMDLGLQAKLLRVLQEKEVERLGGKKTIKLDVRVLATTNRNMQSEIQKGTFREDLFFRLSVFPVQWEALRNRRKDILPIAETLLLKYRKKMEKDAILFSDGAKQALLQYPWPGNIRELDNVIQRALIMCEGHSISPEDLCLFTPGQIGVVQGSSAVTDIFDAGVATSVSDFSHGVGQESQSPVESDDILNERLAPGLKDAEYKMIIDELKKHNGNRTKTAESLGISTRTLRYKMANMRELGIDVKELI